MELKRIVNEGAPLFNRRSDADFPGTIPSFGELFRGSHVAALTHETKKGKDIIQFSFCLTTQDGGVLLMERTDASHRLVLGASVLVSWSPVAESFRFGSSYPSAPDDVWDIFHREISDLLPGEKRMMFLGTAHRKLSDERRYHFYLFRVSTSLTSEALMRLIADWGSESFFVKDREEVLGVCSVEHLIRNNVVSNAVDAGVLHCLCCSPEEPFLFREHCFFVPWLSRSDEKDTLPSFLFKP